MCRHLEGVERGDIKRLMIFAPPRHGKSELASRRFPAWFLGRNPDKMIICASYGDDLATRFGRDVRRIVTDPLYDKVFPGAKLYGDAKSVGLMDFTAGGTYMTTTIGGGINGHGAHCLIIDDPMKGRKKAESPSERAAVWDWYLGDALQRLEGDAPVIMMMTRWHEDDLAGRALAGEEWTVLKLPAIRNSGTDHEEALWEEKFPLKWLRERRDFYSATASARDWNSQYQQDPTTEEGEQVKREWFRIRYDEAPKNMNIYMASDYAVSEPKPGTDPDWTEHGVFGVGIDKKVYPVDWWSGRTTPDVWCEKLLDLIETWGPACIFEEGGVILKSVSPLLNRMARDRGGYADKDVITFNGKNGRVSTRRKQMNPIGEKIARGRSFQGMAAMGRFVFPKVHWAEDVIEQCVAVPGGKHDDKYDVLSLLCRGLDKMTDAVVRTERKRIQERNWKVL